jgi:hypothetical protein
VGIKYEPKITQLTDEEIRRRIEELEDRRGMTSDEFLKRYNAGELEPERDYIRWAGLLTVAAKVGVKIKIRA